MNCPICGNESKKLYSITKKQIIENLESRYKNIVNPDVEIIEEYEIKKCKNCKYEFAFPKIEGSSTFYNWITNQETYYPQSRWEYKEILEIIENRKSNKLSLIDIGCGDGMFLEEFKNKFKNKFIFCGLDTTLKSINKCLSNGIEAYCMDISMFKNTYPEKKFDIIVSFHCLEHIGNVNQFIIDMKSLLNDGGSIFISTPYSPMTFELDWFDILNHPPHHMGRWNINSYKSLAKVNNLDIKFYFPNDTSFIKNAISSFLISEKNEPLNFVKNIKLDFFKTFFKRPIQFLKHLKLQRKREKYLGKYIPNVVLVELKNI